MEHLFIWFLASCLLQRAWLLKLLAIELHAAYVSAPHHREACQSILAHFFGQDLVETGTDIISQSLILQNRNEHAATRTISKTKVILVMSIVIWNKQISSHGRWYVKISMRYWKENLISISKIFFHCCCYLLPIYFLLFSTLFFPPDIKVWFPGFFT